MPVFAGLTLFFRFYHDDEMTRKATIETNRGTLTAELYDKEAPNTVANFEKLANEGYYDRIKFHRVITDFF